MPTLTVIKTLTLTLSATLVNFRHLSTKFSAKINVEKQRSGQSLSISLQVLIRANSCQSERTEFFMNAEHIAWRISWINPTDFMNAASNPITRVN